MASAWRTYRNAIRVGEFDMQAVARVKAQALLGWGGKGEGCYLHGISIEDLQECNMSGWLSRIAATGA